TLCCVSILSAQDSWVTTSNLEHGYSIEFPKTPALQSQQVPTEVGNLSMDYYMLDLSTDASSKNLVYMSAYTTYPANESYSDEGLQNSMLDGSVDGAVKNINGKLLSSEHIKFQGYRGRYAKISIYNDAYIVNLKNILVDNRLYFVQVITLKANDDNSDLKRFMTSFELIKRK
ncbi:MAG: hypothetical protein HKN54_07895, partial [Flavobacteriaceae bacterium]|nr:hypothetical protein [Flavobacteriaceae bacterium]